MKILIAEDEKTLNDLVQTVVKSLGHDAHVAYNGNEAIEILMNETVDLVLLDIIMPEVTGFEVLEFCQLENIHVPTVVLSSLDSDKDQLKGFNYPIEDYWTKPMSFMIMMKKLERLISRIDQHKNDVVAVDDDQQDVYVKGTAIGLTNLEYRMFRYLYGNKGRYCSKQDIMMRTWGDEADVDERNVDFTIKRIRKKLGDYAPHIKTKVKVGYAYED